MLFKVSVRSLKFGNSPGKGGDFARRTVRQYGPNKRWGLARATIPEQPSSRVYDCLSYAAQETGLKTDRLQSIIF